MDCIFCIGTPRSPASHGFPITMTSERARWLSQITSLTIVYLTVYSGAYQSKHQSSASLAFVWGIHRGPVNSPHKWPVTRKMFPFDDVIMLWYHDVLKPRDWQWKLLYSFDIWNYPVALKSDKCLFNPCWRHQMESFSALLALCAGIHRWPSNSPHKDHWRRAWCFLWSAPWNKRFSKQSRRGWFRTTSRSLWRHWNVNRYTKLSV